MCCNQASYQEEAHPKRETEQPLRYSRRKKIWFWNPRKKKQLCTFSLLIFKQGNLSLLQTRPLMTPRPAWGYADLQRALQAQPYTCIWFMCGRTYDFPLHPSEGVLLFERAVFLACWKRSPFSSAPSSQGFEWPLASQRSLLLLWQWDLRISPLCLRGSPAVPVQDALLYWGFKFIFNFFFLSKMLASS